MKTKDRIGKYTGDLGVGILRAYERGDLFEYLEASRIPDKPVEPLGKFLSGGPTGYGGRTEKEYLEMWNRIRLSSSIPPGKGILVTTVYGSLLRKKIRLYDEVFAWNCYGVRLYGRALEETVPLLEKMDLETLDRNFKELLDHYQLPGFPQGNMYFTESSGLWTLHVTLDWYSWFTECDKWK